MRGLLRKDFYLLWSYCRLMPLFLLAFIIVSHFFGIGIGTFVFVVLSYEYRISFYR